jgi:hypothetical protein
MTGTIVPHAMRRVCYQRTKTELQWFVFEESQTRLKEARQTMMNQSFVSVVASLTTHSFMLNPTTVWPDILAAGNVQ